MADRSSQRTRVTRLGDETPARVDDRLATEEPLEIRLSGEPLTVIMRTPGDDRHLVLGFLFSEGIIRGKGDVAAIDAVENGEHPDLENILDVRLQAGAPGKDARWQRHFFAASSCGLCGVSSIEAIHRQAAPIPPDGLRIDPEVVFGLDAKLRTEQSVFAATGGLHAAGLFTRDGAPIVVREDIGRHNAVDKVVGYAVAHDLVPLRDVILMVSGRTSFEIVQKALMAGIPVIAAVSAPSSLARDLAQASNQTLIGFLRGRRLNVYAGRDRVAGPV